MSHSKIFCLVAALSLIPSFASSTNAAIVTLNFSGTVTSVDASLAPTFSVGQTLNGSYSFDTTTVARAGSNSTSAVFDALTAFNFSIGAYAASSVGAPEIQVEDDPPGTFVDRYALVSRASDGLSGAAVNGNALIFFGFRMDDSTNTAITNALVLPTNPSLSSFDSNSFFILFGDPGSPVVVDGTLTSLTNAAIPEPATIAIWSLGVLSCTFGAARRRRAVAVPAASHGS